MSHGPSTLGSMMTSSLCPDGADDLDHVVERPGRIERVDARPQAGRAEVVRLRHLDEARARRLLGVGRDRILEIAEHHVDLSDQLRHLRAQLLDLRRHEMDHALELDRQLAQRRRRADRERLEEIARELHPVGLGLTSSLPAQPLEQARACAKPLLAAMAEGLSMGNAAVPVGNTCFARWTELLCSAPSAPIPKFASYRGKFDCELRNQRSTSNSMILVRLLNLKFLNECAAI